MCASGGCMCNWSLVYVKMDAEDQLLLSEDVCNQLHITYHFAVTKTNYDATDQHPPSITVYCIKVKLLQIVRIPPLQSTDTVCLSSLTVTQHRHNRL